MTEIEGLSPKLEFVGNLPETDKPWKIMSLGWKRFVLLNEDFPPRLVAVHELREKRVKKNDCQGDDGA